MELCLALLFCLFAFVSGQCCQKEVDYCPITYPSTLARTCTSFGSGHIHTFDGLSYNFHEYGDFYLLTGYSAPGSLSIQVRQSDCSSGDTLAVPVNGKATFKGTCNRAFAFQSTTAPTVEIRHDVNTDYITVVNGSQVLTPALTYPLLNLQVVPLAYVATTADISRPLGADADFFVTGSFQGVSFIIWFYASGYSTFQVLLPNEQFLGQLGGLCGFVDGCTANDLTLRANPPLNAPSAPQASILETVRSTNEITVSAGNLPNGAQFINQTSADPSKWAPGFGASWRVDSTHSAFSTEPDSPNLRWTASSYGTSSGSCNFPSGYNPPAFLAAQCAMDQQFNSDTVNGFSFGSLPSYHVLSSYCSYYCQQGVFPFLNQNLLPNHCNGYCTYPQGTVNGFPDITSIYGQAPNWKQPPNNLYQTNDPTAIFTSTLNLAGVYTFQLTSTDSCQSREYNLTRTLTCSNKVTVSPVTQTPIVRRIQIYNGVYPTVQVFIPVPNNVVRAQTTFVQLPNGLVNENFNSIWGDSGDKSFAPSFSPDIRFPGTYIIQLAVYDGCSIIYQNISIIAACASCAPTAIVDNPNLKDVIWGAAFNMPLNGPQPTGVQSFPTKNLHANTLTNIAPDYNYQWQIVNDDTSLDSIVLNGVNNYDVRRYQDSSIAAFAMMYPNGTLINSTSTNWTGASVVGLPVPNPTPTLPALKGPTNSQFGVTPPPREFAISRSDTTTTTQQTTVVQHFANITYSQSAPYFVPCQISLVPNPLTGGQNVSVGFTSTSATGFNDGAACVGQYNFILNVSETSCAWAKDDEKLDVDCGPTPDVLVQCLAQTQFDYVGQSFPTVTIDASATTDPYGRTPAFLYGYASEPGNDTAFITPFGNVAFADVSDPGTYQVWVNVSNGCNSAVAISTFIAYCTGSASQITPNFVFNAPVTGASVNYDQTSFGFQIVTITQNSNSTNPDVGTNLLYAWSFVNLPPNPEPYWIAPPSFSDPSNSAPLINLTYANTPITLQMLASQGCGQNQTQTATITLNCDSTGNPTLTSTSPGQTIIMWTQGQGWQPNIPTLTGTPGVSFSGSAPGTGATTKNWYTDTSRALSNITFGTYFGATASLYASPTPTVQPGGLNSTVTFWTTDGCKFYNIASNFTWICYGSTLSFTPVLAQVGTTSTYTVILDGSASNFSMFNINPTWTVVGPAGTVIPTTFLNQSFVQFTATLGGVYNITMAYTDGCETLNLTQSVTRPDCFNLTLSPGAYIGGGASRVTAVTWASNGFPKFELNGNGSNTGGRNSSFFTYSWIMAAAPSASIFAPTMRSTPVQSIITNTTDPPVLINGYLYTKTNSSWFTTTTTTTTFVTLANNPNSINFFPSCFYPDVEGTYVVQLVVNDGCQTQASNLTLEADCGFGPSIGVNVTEHPNLGNDSTYVKKSGNNQWTVTLSRIAPRRVVLDARSTYIQTNSTSRLTFYWSWNAPDPRAMTLEAQDDFESPYASMTTLSLSAVGTYNVLLTVHDGCSVSTQAITITAVCGDPAVAAPVSSSNTNTDGRTYATLQLNVAASCATNTWTLTNFSTNPKYAASSISNAALVTRSSTTFVLFLVFLISTLL